VHAEDVLRLVLDNADLTELQPESIMHTPVVVPLTKKVDEMFDFFTNHNARAAAVLNEFGGVEGFVTMKDVLTFIFGQISGDVDGQELYQERDEDTYEVDGDMKLTDFNNLTNFGIEDPRMTTIGGVAFRHLDRLPQVGDSISIEDIVITILEMDEHRIHRVRVNRGGKVEESGDDAMLQEPDVMDAGDGVEKGARPDHDESGKDAPSAQADRAAEPAKVVHSDSRDVSDTRQDPQRKANV
jgi:CBS domain containing-hemolysin-like protein